ncbi:uncharacterized protein LOC122507647 isoform X2 [Leptopilina heterotoma]|uniref:uncharacterized protein LOC122507647 isoform X2 n=1 Tax=Leptopilina heterotoma TaxID=63436 RepID=UPI001CA9AB9F|nr:uncharacterized protein LOC122507647 isoform X2 [Leptopilina heterotoma]
MDKNENKLPFILQYCFKDAKRNDENNVNISAVCKVCSKTLKGSVVSTINFLNHLKIKGHADMLKDYEKLKPVSVKATKRKAVQENCTSKTKTMKQSTLGISEKSVNLDKLILNFVVETMSPVSIIENKSFKDMLEAASKLTKPPKVICRQTLNNKIEENDFGSG